MKNLTQGSVATDGTVPRLSINGVKKFFFGVKALNQVSFEVRPGEVHALCGENGAGKSTLMRLIAGVERPDEGEILLDGEYLEGVDELTAGKIGIGMVHQERSLIPTLSIAENVFAGRQPTNRLGIINRTYMNKRTIELLKELKMELNPSKLVEELSPAQQQMVEIAKALSHDLRLLILDEPTAALTIAETEHLFEVIRHLSEQGVSVIYISHRLAEVFRIASRVTVMKDGQVTGVLDTKNTTEDQLIQLMVGREVLVEPDLRRSNPDAPVVLQVDNLSSLSAVHHASFSIKAGEIKCIAGLVGAGRTELCESIFGARPITNGKVLINGQECRIHDPSDAMKYGIGMVPEDRKEDGLSLEMSVKENIIATDLKAVSKNGVLSKRRCEEIAHSYVDQLRVATPHLDQPVINLSGGNQQKVLLAKWLTRKPKVLIVDEPTRGVDVGARADIYKVLRDLAASGIAILVVSSDLTEVLALAHRIIVMSEGYTVGELDAQEATEMSILRMASPTSARKGVMA